MSNEKLQRLARRLEDIEPDLPGMAKAQTLGDADQLLELLSDEKERVRANAISALSLVDGAAFVRMLPAAAADASRIVRMQAAACMRNISPDALLPAHDVAVALLNDPDPGVRKFALKAAAVVGAPVFEAAVNQIRDHDPEAHLRDLAAAISPVR